MNLSLSIHDLNLQRDLQALQDIQRAQAQLDEFERIHKQLSQYDLGILEAAQRIQEQVGGIKQIQNQAWQSDIQTLADMSRLPDVDDDIREIERDLHQHPLHEIQATRRLQEQENELEHLRKLVEPFNHLKMLEALEHYARAVRVTLRPVQHTVHRVQSHTRGKSKSSTRKKSASSGSSGNSGGDGGGDSDGPGHRSTKQIQHQAKHRRSAPPHPPAFPSGAIANTSVPIPLLLLIHGQGLLASLCLLHWAIAIVFLLLCEHDMAWAAIGSSTLLVRSIAKSPKRKR
jgi:cell fate (sporulation/competence/biofilm development) regulator YmcA (YheA/YmcA/DUF963 family)